MTTRMALLMLCLYLVPWGNIHAGFVSPSYQIDSYTIGIPGASMQSPQYQLSSGYRVPATHAEVVEPEVPEVPPEETPVDESVSQSTRVTRFPNVQDVIFDQSQSVVVFDEKLPVETGVVLNAIPQERMYDSSSTRALTEYPASDNENIAVDPRASGERETASLITGSGMFLKQLNEMYQSVFQYRSARVVTALCVLLGLLYVRSYTRIGRTYRPF